tara:strand:- start:2063 stop:2248 length:186 start_codon:yes stop_codon:yes gene_type:complete
MIFLYYYLNMQNKIKDKKTLKILNVYQKRLKLIEREANKKIDKLYKKTVKDLQRRAKNRLP